MSKRDFILLALIYPVYFVSIIVHECGHALAALLAGGTIVEMMIGPMGGYTISLVPIDATIIVSLMGGLLQGFMFSCMGRYLDRAFDIPAIACIIYALFEGFYKDYDILGAISGFIFMAFICASIVYIYRSRYYEWD